MPWVPTAHRGPRPSHIAGILGAAMGMPNQASQRKSDNIAVEHLGRITDLGTRKRIQGGLQTSQVRCESAIPREWDKRC